MKIAITQFGGIAPLVHPVNLADFAAQAAENYRSDGGDLRPLIGPGVVPGVTLGRAADGVIRTIYRYGQDTPSETQHWLQWLSADVSVQRGLIPGDTDERTFWTGDGVPQAGDATLINSGDPTRLPGASHQLGLPVPGKPTVAVTGTATGTDVTYHAYRVRYVNQWGDLGPASPASDVVAVAAGQSVSVVTPTYGAAYDGELVKTYVYRSVDAVYYWTGEQPFNAGTPFIDAMAAASSDELDTVSYDPPPADLHSLVALPNGSFAGASGLDLRLTPPYRPYAWPDDYRNPLDYKIVGLCRFGQYLVALTTGVPYLATASDPASVVPDAIRGFPHACSSRRSIVETNRGVIYAGPSGLCLINPGVETTLLTEKMFTREQWQAMFKPDSIHAYFHAGKYFAFYDTGAKQGGFIFDPSDAKSPLTPISTYATAGYVDRQSDALFLVIGGVLHKWGAGAALPVKFKSKRFMFGWETSWPYMQVLADGYPVTVKLYANKADTPFFTFAVPSAEPFTIPSLRYRFLEIEVESAYPIFGVFLAPSVTELKSG